VKIMEICSHESEQRIADLEIQAIDSQSRPGSMSVMRIYANNTTWARI
jgi:hypothetical protein